ncbi:MAG TPA: lysophospholipid acyltransferase family protein [Magnetospirillaceae bacterium]|nr:lysophospholipid acyltransferase family protein [Magnetospirillaceae bacterium]
MKNIHSPLTAALRAFGLVTWILFWMAVFTLFKKLSRPRTAAFILKRVIYRGLVKISGFKIEVIGTPSTATPTLYVANHCSYFDIMVLGSLLEAAFIAKKEVGTWPGIGFLATLAGTVYVERRARHSRTQRDEMKAKLDGESQSLILFPEGTSSDGRSVLPFKSALFSVAEGGGSALPVQPISLSYNGLDGLPMGRNWRSYFAWYGDMELADHIWLALGLGKARVTVVFHPPVTMETLPSRKALADHCFTAVRRGVSLGNAGRAAESLA